MQHLSVLPWGLLENIGLDVALDTELQLAAH